MNSSRQKIPFGITQIGKAFRNKITPGNFLFRMREFEQVNIALDKLTMVCYFISRVGNNTFWDAGVFLRQMFGSQLRNTTLKDATLQKIPIIHRDFLFLKRSSQYLGKSSFSPIILFFKILKYSLPSDFLL